MSFQVHFYNDSQQQIHHDSPVLIQQVIPKHRSLVFVRIQQVIAITMLSFLFWLWFGVRKDHTPQPSYPYYDMQGQVPPWSEPSPIAGNYAKKGEHR